MNRIIREIQTIIEADRIILEYPELKSRDNRVNLHYYFASHGEDEDKNLGDHLSKLIVEWMLSRRGLSLETEIQGKKHLYAIGSILLMGYQNAVIWGSGFPFEPDGVRALFHSYPFRKLDVRCVRGPKSRAVMQRIGQKCPEIYGDPAVLMPMIYTPAEAEKTVDYLIIPHYSTEKSLLAQIPGENIVSMNTWDYKAVIDRICSAKKVVSSSLHGLILAEAYGVPAVYYQDRAERFVFKYEDYYESTGRTLKIYKSWQEAAAAETDELPELQTMQRALLESFPYDLWT